MDCFAGQAVFGGHIPRWAKTMRWEGADIFLRYHRDNILGIIRNPTAMSVSEQAIPLRKQIDCQGHWNIYNVCREQWDKSIMFQDNFLYLKYFQKLFMFAIYYIFWIGDSGGYNSHLRFGWKTISSVFSLRPFRMENYFRNNTLFYKIVALLIFPSESYTGTTLQWQQP